MRVTGIWAELWIEEIEKRRVNKSAFRAYVKKPARAVAERVLPERATRQVMDWIARRKRSSSCGGVDQSRAEENFRRTLEGFSMDQFKLSEEPRRVGRSMDLFAVAKT